MKKALTIVSIIGSTVASAFAQIAVGTPVTGTRADPGALFSFLKLVRDTFGLHPKNERTNYEIVATAN